MKLLSSLPLSLFLGLSLAVAPAVGLADIADDDDDTPAGDDDDSAAGDDDDDSSQQVHDHGDHDADDPAGCAGCSVSPLQQDLGAAAVAFLLALGAAGALRRGREG